jgi:hypothetical protein
MLYSSSKSNITDTVCRVAQHFCGTAQLPLYWSYTTAS